MALSFQASALTTGPYSNAYGWSNLSNWVGGKGPTSNSNVVFSGTNYTSLIDESLTISQITIATGIKLIDAGTTPATSASSLTVNSGTTVANSAEFDIGTNAYLSSSTLTGGTNDIFSIGVNAIVTVQAGISFGNNTSFNAATNGSSGYISSSFLTLGSNSTVSIATRLMLTNNLTLGNNNQLITSGSAANIKASGLSMGNGSYAVFNGGIVSIANGLTLGSFSTATVAAGVQFAVGSLYLGADSSLYVDSGTAAAPSKITTIGSLDPTAAVVVDGDLQINNAVGGSYSVDNGGVLEITQNLNGSASQFTLDGGTIQLDATVNLPSGTGFTFAGTQTSLLSVASANNFSQSPTDFAYTISGFDFGDTLKFPSVTFAAGDTISYSTTADDIIVKNGKNVVLDVSNVSFGADVTATNATFLMGSHTLTLTCFLEGTLIETPSGAKPIESLTVGDEVTTLVRGVRVNKPARWIGRRAVDLTTLPDCTGLYPVRIRADAFADGVPSRDLLVTPEHCIFVDGGLIPARMLVNGSSIVTEATYCRFVVYHIEMEQHAILISEGLETESYLDTGNRDSFGSSTDDATRRVQSWAEAAAPLITSRDRVEPVWRRLRNRAIKLGHHIATSSVTTVADPQVRLLLDNGRLLWARRQNGERHFFVLPAGTRRIAIVSRTFVPAEIEGPFIDDRRRLGVAVADVKLWVGLQTESLAVDPRLPGWHEDERASGAIWTDGAGMIETGRLDQATLIEMTITAHAAYTLNKPEVCFSQAA